MRISTHLQNPRRIALSLMLTALFCCVPSEASTPDFNNDGQINFSDFILFSQNFGTNQNDPSYNASYDLDNSGSVGFGDFVQFIQLFGTTVEPQPTNQHSLEPDIGGTIALDNGPQIQVPPGALSGPGTLTIDPIDLNSDTEPQDATRVSQAYEINLQGTSLTNPVELAIPYDFTLLPDDATIEDMHIAWWDGENWRPVPSTVDPQFIRAQVDHFSQWTGVFARTPSAKVFAATPDSVVLQATEIKNLSLNLNVDPAGIRASDLRVRLTLSLSDGVRNTALGRFTLSDNGATDPAPKEPIAGISISSSDPTDPLDSNYGAAIVLDANTLPDQYSQINATVTLTTRRIASIAIDTTITIPITRLRPTRFAVSGRLLNGQTGIANATVVLAGQELKTTTTNTNGEYTFTDLEKGTYVITPTKQDHNFSPATLTVNLADQDLTNINFTEAGSGPAFAAGDALELNGDAYLAIDVASGSPLNISTGAFTIEAWIRPSDRSSRTIIGRWEGKDQTPAGQWFLGTQEAGIHSNTSTFTSPIGSTWQSDTWVHYAMVVQNDQLIIYIDGTPFLETATGLTGLYSGAFSNDQLIIGGFKNGTGRTPAPFKGLIDEVRIWNHALSPKTLRENMHRSLSTQSALTQSNNRTKQALNTGLIGYWNFDTQNASGQVPDLSGFGGHGQIISPASRVASNAPIGASSGNPVLQILPSELSVPAAPLQTEFQLRNLGSGQLVWTISENAGWLRITSAQDNTDGDGAFHGGDEQMLTVHTDGTGLPGGQYSAIVHIWSTGGLLEFPITLDNGPGEGGEVPNAPVSSLDAIDHTTPAGTIHKMVLIPAGEFTMGSTQGVANASPPHTVFLDAFRIAQFEVTNAHYTAFVNATARNPSAFANDGRYNDPKQPVVGVSQRDASDYCAWIGGRLPTEAQWEKAARGIDGRTYPWGESEPAGNLLNHNRTIGTSSPVGSHSDGASPYGIEDMAGNVWEWTTDWYSGSYYANSPAENPTGPTTGSIRVVRGGSWAESTDFVRTFQRFWFVPSYASELIGFRCVIDP